MHWLRFAAIWVYCLGTIFVPGLHHALHVTAHASHPAGCSSNDCRHDENPFSVRKLEKLRQRQSASATVPLTVDGGAQESAAVFSSSPSAHDCSETCVVCLATSVLGHALATAQPPRLAAIAKSSLPIVDQDRWAQVCAGESVPRGPPAACCEICV